MTDMTDMTEQLMTDSAEMLRIFSTMGNPSTGVGTVRDKITDVEIRRPRELSAIEIESLYRGNGLLQRIVNAYPDAAIESWAVVATAKGEVEKFQQAINRYKNLFEIASSQSRLYGTCFLAVETSTKTPEKELIIGIEKIKRLRVCRSLKKSITGEHYIEANKEKDTLWHRTRILPFYGVPFYSENGDVVESDSVFASIIEAYQMWLMGLKSTATMLSDSCFLKVGMKGLGQATKDENGLGIRNVLMRLLSLDRNRSVSRSVAYDLGNEVLEHESREFGGVDESLDRLERFLAIQVDIPRWKLFGEESKTGLAVSVASSHLQKAGWCSQVKEWKERNWRSNLEYLLKIESGSETSGLSIEFPLGLTLSELEQAELEYISAQRLDLLVSSGIITPEEARGCYSGTNFRLGIILR